MKISHKASTPLAGFGGLVAFMAVFVLMLAGHAVFLLPGGGRLVPWFIAAGVFYWALFDRRSLPITAVFVLGLCEDFVVGTPLGLHALGLLVIYKLAAQQRRFLTGRPFRVIWFGFGVISACGFTLIGCFNWFLGHPVSLWIILSWLLSCLFFPAVYMLMAALRRQISDDIVG